MSVPGLSLPGQDTLLGCWRALARLSRGARVVRTPTLAAAVFPAWEPLNNAIVLSAAPGGDDDGVVEARGLFGDADVDAWALWFPSRATDLTSADSAPDVPGFTRDVTTLVMHAAVPAWLRLHDDVVRTSVAAACLTSDPPVPQADLPEPDALPGLDAWVMVHHGVAVSGGWTFLRGADCGVYAVETLPGWRRRGLAAALVEHALADAQRRGARTASLQSTPMGQPLYESLGFRPVGRYEEWVPQPGRRDPVQRPRGTGRV